MAYYSGQASSYQELLSVLVNACVEQGWTWADGILSKGTIFLKLIIESNGIVATAAIGKNSNILINAAPTSPRLGNPGFNVLIVFPVSYHIFIFDDEVYLKVKFKIDIFYYLAFGKSNISLPSNGLWVSATSNRSAYIYNGDGISIGVDSGGAGGGGSNPSAVAPFWNANNYSDNFSNAVISHGFDGVIWSSGSNNATFAKAISNLQSRQPSNWSSESILQSFDIYLDRPSGKKSLICQFKHARYLRNDHYEPEQIINMGQEKWMIFPFYKKNINARNGGGSDHTGTFGWAIRYDGP